MIFPVLTPLGVDPAHPFPYISDLSLNLAVVVRDPRTGTRRFARVKVPPLLPRFLKVPGGRRFAAIEQVIAANLDRLFPGMEIVEQHAFRVTRDADVEVEVEEADDLLATLESLLRDRQRTPEAVRLEVASSMSQRLRSLLLRELQLTPPDLYSIDGLLNLGDLWSLDGPEAAGAEGQAVARRDAARARLLGDGAKRRPGQAPRARHPRAAPLRPLRDVRRGARRPGRRRPGRARHQADDLPDVGRGRGAGRALARAGRGGGQGGGRPRRADGQGRRRGEHRLGEDAREGRRSRPLRRRRA